MTFESLCVRRGCAQLPLATYILTRRRRTTPSSTSSPRLPNTSTLRCRVLLCVYTRTHARAHTHTHTYTHTRIHTHTHTHNTHTHTTHTHTYDTDAGHSTPATVNEFSALDVARIARAFATLQPIDQSLFWHLAAVAQQLPFEVSLSLFLSLSLSLSRSLARSLSLCFTRALSLSFSTHTRAHTHRRGHRGSWLSLQRLLRPRVSVMKPSLITSLAPLSFGV